MTCFAIGAATSPPVRDWVVRSTVTAMATFGSFTGAKAMNHAWLAAPFAT